MNTYELHLAVFLAPSRHYSLRNRRPLHEQDIQNDRNVLDAVKRSLEIVVKVLLGRLVMLVCKALAMACVMGCVDVLDSLAKVDA